ncbi:mCG147372 [Mus musculus]|nr:mCG147372 [Mus musculus]
MDGKCAVLTSRQSIFTDCIWGFSSPDFNARTQTHGQRLIPVMISEVGRCHQ